MKVEINDSKAQLCDVNKRCKQRNKQESQQEFQRIFKGSDPLKNWAHKAYAHRLGPNPETQALVCKSLVRLIQINSTFKASYAHPSFIHVFTKLPYFHLKFDKRDAFRIKKIITHMIAPL